MAYWEFLFQKDGDRAWLPLNSQEIEEGRYRIVAHTSRKNCDVDIRITYQTVGEIPPRRRTQTRSRRTNEEGLMVIIPYTYLRKGVWEFRCTGDIMSDLVGQSWQHSVRLTVQPRNTVNTAPMPQSSTTEAIERTLKPSQTPIPSPEEDFISAHPPEGAETAATANAKLEETSENISSPNTGTLAETAATANAKLEETSNSFSHTLNTDTATETANTTQLEEVPQNVSSTPDTETVTETAAKIELEEASENVSPNTETATETAATTQFEEASENIDSTHHTETKEEEDTALEKDITAETSIPTAVEAEQISTKPSNEEENKATFVANSLLEESLKSLEDILHQVVEPMVQEIEEVAPVPPDKQPSQDSSEPARRFETAENERFAIVLDQDSLMREDGKTVVISGQLTSLLDTQLNEIEGELHLCYELRNPQTSQVLSQTKFPLSVESLPAEFSHSLEIPDHCKLHLILGEVFLESTSQDSPVILANQPFTITADVAELLGAIFATDSPAKASPETTIPETEEIESQQEKESVTLPIEAIEEKPKVLIRSDFVEVAKKGKPTLQLQPIAYQVLPAKIARPSSNLTKKSPQLPVLPKPKVAEVEVEESIASKEESSPEKANEIKTSEQTNTSDSEEISLSPDVEVIETSTEETSTPETENKTETTPSPKISEEEIEVLKSLVNTELDDEDEETGIQPLSVSETDELTLSETKPNSEEDEFQQLNLEKRFWSHLNSLVVENESSDWLLDTPSPVEEEEDTEVDLESIDEEGEILNEANHSSLTESEVETEEENNSLLLEVEDEQNSLELEIEDETEEENNSLLLEVEDEQNSLELEIEDETEEEEDNSLQSETKLNTDNTQELDHHFADWEDAAGLLFTKDEISEALSSQEETPEIEEESVVELTASETEDIPLETSPPLAKTEDVEEDSHLEVESQKVDFVEEVWPLTNISVSQEVTHNSGNAVDPADWSNYEIVVEDDEVYIAPPAKPKHDTSGLPYPQKITPPKRPSPVLARQQLEIPVPQPQLILPNGELTAGDMLIIRVTLSPYPRSVYVKLWIQDRQTRMLLDGPRALVDFEVNEAGEWETLTQLTVPYGSMEVRFEAIAIDTETQQESHKISLDRIVVPENLPQFSLEEL